MENKKCARDLVAQEAWLIDTRAWDGWLDLYAEDAVFWVPTWLDDETISDDPNTQISAIYIEGKEGLCERVRKATDPRSPASIPFPRTTHVLGPIHVNSISESTLVTSCSWQSSIYTPKEKQVISYSGRYEHELCRDAGGILRIKKKIIVVINDQVASKLDFFYV